MIFQLSDAVASQSKLWLSSDEFVDKISCLVAPIIRNLILLELNIFGQH